MISEKLCHTATAITLNSKQTYTRYVFIRRRNTSRSGGENLSAELDGCTVRLRRVVA